MNCPHCNASTKALVVETRKHEGNIYRRRSCGRCGGSFVTQEQAPAGLKMPAAVVNGRARGQHVQPSRAMSTRSQSTGDGAHLEGIWR